MTASHPDRIGPTLRRALLCSWAASPIGSPAGVVVAPGAARVARAAGDQPLTCAIYGEPLEAAAGGAREALLNEARRAVEGSAAPDGAAGP